MILIIIINKSVKQGNLTRPRRAKSQPLFSSFRLRNQSAVSTLTIAKFRT